MKLAVHSVTQSNNEPRFGGVFYCLERLKPVIKERERHIGRGGASVI